MFSSLRGKSRRSETKADDRGNLCDFNFKREQHEEVRLFLCVLKIKSYGLLRHDVPRNDELSLFFRLNPVLLCTIEFAGF